MASMPLIIFMCSFMDDWYRLKLVYGEYEGSGAQSKRSDELAAAGAAVPIP